MQACIILHNMTVEDEQDMASTCFGSDIISETSVPVPSDINNGPADCFADLLRKNATIYAKPIYNQLRRDLIEHVWQRFGPFGDKYI